MHPELYSRGILCYIIIIRNYNGQRGRQGPKGVTGVASKFNEARSIMLYFTRLFDERNCFQSMKVST